MLDYLKQVYRLPFYLDLKWNDDYTLLAAFCDVFFLKEALREQKSRREHQVTMYRKYRKGDLPDIQIKYSYIIAPLQAVAHVSIQRVIYSVSDMQIIYSYIIAPIQAVVHVCTERAIYQTYRSSISTS